MITWASIFTIPNTILVLLVGVGLLLVINRRKK